MHLLSGKLIADAVLQKAAQMIRTNLLSPGLAVVLIGSDPASEIYVGLKEKAAVRIGIRFEKHTLSAAASELEVRAIIEALNGRSDIHGIIVQLPLPENFDTEEIIRAIAPTKDADGFHPETVERFLMGREIIPPVFPRAIHALLQSTGVSLQGKRAIVFANSELFANVMSKVLASNGIIAENSLRLGEAEAIKRLTEFEIIISAKGTPNFFKGDMVRPGAILIDGGIVREGEKVFSDADQSTFTSIDGFITPVPGGVGPVTVAFLLSRVVELALTERREESIL